MQEYFSNTLKPYTQKVAIWILSIILPEITAVVCMRMVGLIQIFIYLIPSLFPEKVQKIILKTYEKLEITKIK